MSHDAGNCRSCGKPWSDHDGIAATCELVQKLSNALARSLASGVDVRIEPDGTTRMDRLCLTISISKEMMQDHQHPEIVADMLADSAAKQIRDAIRIKYAPRVRP